MLVHLCYRYKAHKCSHPIHYAWDRADLSVQGHCFNVDGFFIGSGSANVAINFVIFVLVRLIVVPLTENDYSDSGSRYRSYGVFEPLSSNRLF